MNCCDFGLTQVVQGDVDLPKETLQAALQNGQREGLSTEVPREALGKLGAATPDCAVGNAVAAVVDRAAGNAVAVTSPDAGKANSPIDEAKKALQTQSVQDASKGYLIHRPFFC